MKWIGKHLTNEIHQSFPSKQFDFMIRFGGSVYLVFLFSVCAFFDWENNKKPQKKKQQRPNVVSRALI